MLGVRRLGDGEERRAPHKEAKRHLALGCGMRVGDLLQDATAGGPRAGKSARVAERAVSDDRDAVFFAPGDPRCARSSARANDRALDCKPDVPVRRSSKRRRDRARRSCSRPTTGSCPHAGAARRRRSSLPARESPASAGDNSPIGRCRGARAIARTPKGSRRERRYAAGPWKRGRPRRAAPRAPRPPIPRRRPNRIVRRCRRGSCRNRDRGAKRISRSPKSASSIYQVPWPITGASRIVEPNVRRSMGHFPLLAKSGERLPRAPLLLIPLHQATRALVDKAQSSELHEARRGQSMTA